MKTEKENLDLEKIFEQIDIVPGDKIMISSNILEILMKLKKNYQKFDGNLIIDFLKKKVGPEGTLIFPTYNWEFCSGLDFDYNKTPSRCGTLTNVVLSRKDFKRTKNPIYSFAVTGKDQDHLCELKHYSCFSFDSPFGYLIENNGKNLFIGMDYKEGFAFVHIAEEKAGVNYRYFKEFSGGYIDEFNNKKTVKHRLYVRDTKMNIEQTVIDKKFDDVLIKKKALEKKIINGISFSMVNVRRAYEAMLEDITNKGGLIYPKKND